MTDKKSLIIQNLELARRIARQRKARLSKVSFEDLESAAFFGLVQAAELYDSEKSEKFEQYAVFKIFGAIRDYLRELLWGPRSNRWKRHETELDDLRASSDSCDPELFNKIISVLPSNNQIAMRKYYVDCWRMSEIAAILNVRESRVSQIISESKALIKQKWVDLEEQLYESVA